MGNVATRAGAVAGGLSHGISVSPATFRAGDSVSVLQQFPLDYTQTINQLVIDGVVATPTAVSADQIDFIVPETVSDGAGKILQLTSDGIQATATVQILPPLTVEPEVDAAIQAIVAAGGTVSQTEQDAANVLINTLKTNNLFTSAPLIYLFLGGNAGGHAINWRNPGTNNITWNGTLTHNVDGVRGDGSTGYGNTGYSTLNVHPNAAYIVSRKDLGNSGNRTFLGTDRRGISAGFPAAGLQTVIWGQAGIVQRDSSFLPVTGSLGVSRISSSRLVMSTNGVSNTADIFTSNVIDRPITICCRVTEDSTNSYSQFSSALLQAVIVYSTNLSEAQLNFVTQLLNQFQLNIGR